MKSIITIITCFACLSVNANIIWELGGPLGDTLRQIKSVWSGSNTISGVVEKYSKNDCRELLEESLEEKIPGEIYSYAYFLTPFKDSDINAETSYAINNKKNAGYAGLGNRYFGHLNSLSPKNGVHVVRNCHDFMFQSKHSIVKRTMVYPVYKNGKKTHEQVIKNKSCRVSKLSLDEMSYDVVMCTGDNNAYLSL
jgi:hypothetical protein